MELKHALLIIALACVPSLTFAQGSNQPGPSGPETLTCTVTGTVSVSNMIAAVETGLAKDATFTGAATGAYVRQDSTGTIAKETGGNLATVNTNTAPLVVSGGGGYVRQDSTATIAKESGGNLDKLAKPSSCGTTPYDSGSLDVPPNYPTQVSTTTTCATAVSVTNQTRTPIRFMLYDNATAFRNYYTDWIGPGEARLIPLNGVQLSSGVRWNGSGMGLVAQIRGYQ